jgi:hypothetical protein
LNNDTTMTSNACFRLGYSDLKDTIPHSKG